MIANLPLGFAQPLVLLGLLSLPVLWWLLRLVPPRPQRVDFPPTRLLFEIAPKEETPAWPTPCVAQLVLSTQKAEPQEPSATPAARRGARPQATAMCFRIFLSPGNQPHGGKPYVMECSAGCGG